MNKMYEGEHSHLSEEKSLFLGLSSMLTNFNQLLLLMHKTILYSNQQQHYLVEQHLNQIEQRVKNGIEFLQLPSSWINTQLNSNNVKTFNRFISRLIQSITPLRQKSLQSPSLRPLFVYIKEIQNLILRFHEYESVAKVMKLIYQIFFKFVEEMNTSSLEDTLAIQSKSIRINKINIDKKTVQIQKTFYKETQSEKKIKMLNKKLNETFNTMKGLELDYAHYRSSFFDIKNNFDVYNEYVRRNREIKSNIQLYSKNFKEYLSKKEKRKQQREKLNLLRKNKYLDDSPKKPYSDFAQKKKKSFDITLRRFQNLTNDLSEDQKDQKGKPEKKNDKTYYKMKNIIISASKIKINPLRKDIHNKSIKNPQNKYPSKSQEPSPVKFKLKSQARSLVKNLREITKDFQMKN